MGFLGLEPLSVRKSSLWKELWADLGRAEKHRAQEGVLALLRKPAGQEGREPRDEKGPPLAEGQLALTAGRLGHRLGFPQEAKSTSWPLLPLP